MQNQNHSLLPSQEGKLSGGSQVIPAAFSQKKKRIENLRTTITTAMVSRTKNTPRTQYPRLHHLLLPSPMTLITFRNCPFQCQSSLSLAIPNATLFFFLLFAVTAFFLLSQIRILLLSHLFLTTSSCSSSPPLFFLPLISNASWTLKLQEDAPFLPLPPHQLGANLTDDERKFWEQPDGRGYRPCIEFGLEYRKASASIAKEKSKFLVVAVSGGLNQQRNQIIDAVVIARILGAALVVPILKVNMIWEDESEFSDIFDVEHFKKRLQSDVRIVSSLPSTHLPLQPSVEARIPINASPLWLRTRFLKQLNDEGVLYLKGGLDSKLSKDLPLDLQRLRCKVAFHALRFAAPIREVGEQMARRMWDGGPYIALHVRLEKDVWVRNACPTELGPEYDEMLARERERDGKPVAANPCPLNAFQVARLLKGLGAPRSARVYIAGGEAFGGDKAVEPLRAEFPNVIRKDELALDGELERFANRSSALAAIDFIVSLSSDVFMPSHGGNMGRIMQGHRAYAGHMKFITPNKKIILPLFAEKTLSDEEFNNAVKQIHKGLMGQPIMRTKKSHVIAHPVPECMCKRRTSPF